METLALSFADGFNPGVTFSDPPAINNKPPRGMIDKYILTNFRSTTAQ